jgi:SHS2 domain-containing protein
MYNAMTPIKEIMAESEFRVEADGTDLQSLLINYLGELLYLIDVESLVASSIDVDLDPEQLTLSAMCRGEKFSQATHEVGISVKAPTYHMMEIKKASEGWRIQVVFDT